MATPRGEAERDFTSGYSGITAKTPPGTQNPRKLPPSRRARGREPSLLTEYLHRASTHDPSDHIISSEDGKDSSPYVSLQALVLRDSHSLHAQRCTETHFVAHLTETPARRVLDGWSCVEAEDPRLDSRRSMGCAHKTSGERWATKPTSACAPTARTRVQVARNPLSDVFCTPPRGKPGYPDNLFPVPRIFFSALRGRADECHLSYLRY